jgi:hypothetical protein
MPKVLGTLDLATRVAIIEEPKLGVRVREQKFLVR